MKPLPISADTAVKLAAALRVPIEQLMHMPQHILLAKLAELAKAEDKSGSTASAAPSQDRPKEPGEPL